MIHAFRPPRRPSGGTAATFAGLVVLAALALTLYLGVLLPVAFGGDDAPRLFVFLHTDLRSAALERTLRARLPALNVTVFGRFRDFEEACTTSRPDAVVALGPLLVQQRLGVQLQGVRAGKDWESYSLLSTGPSPPSAGGARTVGVVELLGRSGTQEFVAALLRNLEIKLKRVTKQEDLLALLQFAAADAVLLPSPAAKAFMERSKMPLRVSELPDARVGLPGVAVLNAGVRDVVVRQILGLDPETNRALGVERWVQR